jgi:pSer/pThr/pTyr-binding forkhead associated (FHA) protein
VLERQGDTWFVRDSGSRNGTFLNDRRVECGELTPGTVLGIGLTHLVALGPAGRVRTGFERLIGRDPALLAASSWPARGQHRLQRPDPRRDRHRQGRGGPGHPRASRRATGRTSRSTAAPSRAS